MRFQVLKIGGFSSIVRIYILWFAETHRDIGNIGFETHRNIGNIGFI
jgi:hypothetical protein